MISMSVPPEARRIASGLKDLYPAFSFNKLCAVICYFMLKKSTLSQAVREMTFSPSVSTLGRTFGEININRTLRRMRRSILRKKKATLLSEEWIFVVDDTANPKYGANFYHVGYWGGSGGIFHGQKVLMVALVNLKTRESLPLSYCILPKRHSKQSPKAHWHALRLLLSLAASGFPKFDVCCDSWFDSAEFMNTLNEHGFHFVGQIKANRLVKPGINPKSRWQHLLDAFSDTKRYRTVTDWDSPAIKTRERRAKCIADIILRIKGRKQSLRLIAVYNARNHKSPFAYFASTDLSKSRARIWMISRARWSIEVIFRTLKQDLSFGLLSCEGKEAAHLSVGMPIYLFNKLQEICPDRVPLSKFIAQIRDESQTKAIDDILQKRDLQAVELLKNRRSKLRSHSKPCDKPNGEFLAAA